MLYTQEFLVLETGTEGTFGVYHVRQFPKGTVVGRDARRLRVIGNPTVSPPRMYLSAAELDEWRRALEGSGRSVALEPFWTDPDMLERAREAIARGEFRPAKDVFDELLREADRRLETNDQPMETLKSRHP